MALKYGINNIVKVYLGVAPVSKIILGSSNIVFEHKQTIGDATLVDGRSFLSYIGSVISQSDIKNIYFETYACPRDKISSAKKVSTPSSKYPVYAYAGTNKDIHIAPSVDNVQIIANENANNMFSNLSSLESIQFDNFDSSKTTNMSSMFDSCVRLKNITGNFSTKSLQNAMAICYGCNNLNWTFTIESNSLVAYLEAFSQAAINLGSQIIVNYKNGCLETAKKIVNTKSGASNVKLGSEV